MLTTICYIRQNGKTLMLHRTKKENDISKEKWLSLGGKFEPGETPEECIMREVEEESGLIIKNPRLRGMIMFPGFIHGEDDFMFIFTAEEYEGEIGECNEGDLVWIDDDKLQDLNVWEGDKIFFKWLEQDKIFSAKMIYDGSNLESYQVVFY